MRALAVACVLALAACSLPSAGQPVSPTVRIAEILADPDTATGQREFIELWNAASVAVPLAGWKIKDAPTTSGSVNTFTLPPWTLGPNARLVIWGGGAADSRGPAWSNPTVWNNAGDGATLLDATGAFVDWAGYGTATAPAGFNATVPVAPAKGQSQQWTASGWIASAPTPGLGYGAVGGSLVVDVANAAPAPTFASVPTVARPGSAVTLTLAVTDPNGDADVRSWTLSSGAGTLATGSSGGPQTVHLVAPPAEGPWPLTLSAVDQAGASGNVSAAVAIRSSDLAVTMPAGPLRFSAAGGAAATVSGLMLRNDGAAAFAPLLDVSAFTTATGQSFAAEGHLQIGWGNATWLDYSGPLTPLGRLGPGEQVSVAFRMHDVPGGLPPGSYGASFSVVQP